MAIDIKKEQEREELHRAIIRVNPMRGTLRLTMQKCLTRKQSKAIDEIIAEIEG